MSCSTEKTAKNALCMVLLKVGVKSPPYKNAIFKFEFWAWFI